MRDRLRRALSPDDNARPIMRGFPGFSLDFPSGFPLGLALARTGVCAYRAAEQSLTIDEAHSYSRFVKGQWATIYADYDASHHILYSMLAKLSVWGLGVSEFTIRLPSVVAGFFLIVGLFRLLEPLRSSLIRCIALVAISLHPLLLDFSIAARGYSLSLAFFAWSMVFSFRSKYGVAGVLLGLGVSANLSIAFPALGLITALGLLRPGLIRDRAKALAPMPVLAAVAFLIVSFPSLVSAQRDDFYLGYPTVREALVSFVYTSIHAKIDDVGLFGTDRGAIIIATVVLPLLSAFIVIASYRILKGYDECWRRLIPLVSLVATLGGLVAAHYLVGLKYPADRTCLYLLILFGSAWATAADAVTSKLLCALNLLLAALLTLQFATQFQTRYFQFWTVEMSNKAIAELLKRECEGMLPNSVGVSTTWIHQPSLEFYREYLQISALRPVERRDPTPMAGHDFYVLSGSDREKGDLSQVRVIFTNELAGVVVARAP